MRGPSSSASFDIFLVLSPFREVIPELHVLVQPLAALADQLVGVEGFASADNDAAMVNLRFDRALLARFGVGHVVARIDHLGLVAVAPEAMATADREAFYLGHLAAYDTYVQLYRDDHEAGLIDRVLDALAAHVAPRRRATSRAGLGHELDAAAPRPRRRGLERATSEPAW